MKGLEVLAIRASLITSTFFVGQSVSFHKVFEPYYPWFVAAKLICFNLVTMYGMMNNFLEKKKGEAIFQVSCIIRLDYKQQRL